MPAPGRPRSDDLPTSPSPNRGVSACGGPSVAGGTTSVSSAMYSVLMHCGPRGGGPSPMQHHSPGGTTSVSSAMCLLPMYCGPRRGGPSPMQHNSPGGTTSVSSAMCLVLMYCGPRGGGPSPILCRGNPQSSSTIAHKKAAPFRMRLSYNKIITISCGNVTGKLRTLHHSSWLRLSKLWPLPR